MKYIQPVDQPSNPTAPYVDLNEAMGVDGSIPPAKFFNDVQDEIINVIIGGGLTPDAGVTNQLLLAIQNLIPPPAGGPSDASLVHYSSDTGSANNIILTPSPVASAVSQGFTVFFVPAASATGPANITVNLSPSGNTTRRLLRPNGQLLANGDLLQGVLACAVCTDGADFRLAWLHNSQVVVDNETVFGNGTASSPLSAAVRAPIGGLKNQMATIAVACYGGYNPEDAGLVLGQNYTASALQSGSFPGTNGNLLGVSALGANTGVYASYTQRVAKMHETISGSWKFVSYVITVNGYGAGFVFQTGYLCFFQRVS